MSNIETSRIRKIDVGTPPSTITSDGWEIIQVHYHGFENLTTTRNEYVPSPEFTYFGHNWRLLIYPGGRASSDHGMACIFLQNRSNKSITLQYGYAVVKNNGNRNGWISWLSKNEGNEFAPIGIIDCWGPPNFAKRSEIIGALKDGTLVIEVRMRNIGETTSAPFIPENPFAKAVLNNMFNDEDSADVVFEVGNEKVDTTEPKRAKTTTAFHAHRNILQKCCSSTVLGELCKADGEGVTAISITDVTPEIFRHLLYYVYGGRVSDEEFKVNAKEIIDAADKYGVVNLKLEAEASLVKSTTITFDNMMNNLQYASSKNCALLQEAVLDFALENSDEVLDKVSFDDVPGTIVADLLAATSRKYKGGKKGSDDFSTMRVSELRKKLHEKGLDIDGSRTAMIASLKDHQE